MTLDELKDKLFKQAGAAGFTEYELYYVSGSALSIEAFEDELEKYSVSGRQGVSFRGIYNGKMGYAYTEVLDDASVEFLLNNAKENASIIQNEEVDVIYGGKDSYAEFNGYEEKLAQASPTEKINLAFELVKTAKSRNDKVIRVESGLEDTESFCRIVNSKGLDVSFKSNNIFAAVQPIVSDGKDKNGEDKMNSAFAFTCGKTLEDVHSEELAHDAVDRSLAYSGAKTVPSGNYRVAIENETAASLLQTFSEVFSADKVQKGLSLLKDRIGDKIGSPAVTIVDNPLLREGIKSRPFDDEGVAAYTKEVVKDGSLTTLLYNLKTAAKDGVKSTGNAAKASYASPVEVAPSNFYFQPGDKDFPALLTALNDGLFITELNGLHSGANAVSGDFSLAAKGFLVKGGQIEGPVEQITFSGNFYKVLENVEAVGSDLKFGYPMGKSYFGSPTLLVSEIAIAGE